MILEQISECAIGRPLLTKLTRSLRNSVVHEVHWRMMPSRIVLSFEFRLCTFFRGERMVLGKVHVVIVAMS